MHMTDSELNHFIKNQTCIAAIFDYFSSLFECFFLCQMNKYESEWFTQTYLRLWTGSWWTTHNASVSVQVIRDSRTQDGQESIALWDTESCGFGWWGVLLWYSVGLALVTVCTLYTAEIDDLRLHHLILQHGDELFFECVSLLIR